MEIMYSRKCGKRYEVYGFDVEHNMALCFDPELASRSNGQGWCKILHKILVPEAYADKITGQFMSKTERNAIKHNLKLVSATWECSDGKQFDHSQIDEAIEYQKSLMT